MTARSSRFRLARRSTVALRTVSTRSYGQLATRQPGGNVPFPPVPCVAEYRRTCRAGMGRACPRFAACLAPSPPKDKAVPSGVRAGGGCFSPRRNPLRGGGAPNPTTRGLPPPPWGVCGPAAPAGRSTARLRTGPAPAAPKSRVCATCVHVATPLCRPGGLPPSVVSPAHVRRVSPLDGVPAPRPAQARGSATWGRAGGSVVVAAAAGRAPGLDGPSMGPLSPSMGIRRARGPAPPPRPAPPPVARSVPRRSEALPRVFRLPLPRACGTITAEVR